MPAPVRPAAPRALAAALTLAAALAVSLAAPAAGAQVPAQEAAPVTAPAPSAAADAAGTWRGAIEIPQQGQLGVEVELRRESDGWVGTIDIPQQGATDAPLERIAVDGAAVRFSIAGVPGDPTFDGRLDGDAIAGTFRQGGAELAFSLRRLSAEEAAAAAAGPARPQEPKPPFPYRVEETTLASGGVTLAGTLTLPGGDGPFPGVVLLTGSGAQDRDEALFGHKPFLVLADRLTRAGVAVLRLDDRGVGGSGGSLDAATYAELAADAAAALAHLAARPGVADDRVGLLGHSEGAMLAPRVAAAAADGAPPHFLVLLAGPAVRGDALLRRQLSALARVQGVPAELTGDFDRLVDVGIAALAAGGGAAEIEARVAAETEAIAAERPDADRDALGAFAAGIARMLAGFDRPLFREFLTYDPAPVLAQVDVPVLAIYGERDLNVPPAQNVPALEAALAGDDDGDATIRTLPGLNHLLQPSATGNPAEYGQIEQTMSEEALALVAGWIVERFGKPAPGAP